MITISSNIPSLKAQRALELGTAAVSSGLERLSSGMRINRASDDPVGLGISNSLHADARIYSQGMRNVSDGISALSVAQGALEQMAGITTRQKELAAQAANGTYTLSQRRALDAEARALTQEFNRIAETTEFNGIQLFQMHGGGVRVQVGYGEAGSIFVTLGASLARTVGDGTFEAAVTFDSVSPGHAGVYDGAVADMNGDGKPDQITSGDWGFTLAVRLGNGDGTFEASKTFRSNSPVMGMAVADFDNDGTVDVLGRTAGEAFTVFLGNGDGSLRASQTYDLGVEAALLKTGDFNSDGSLDFGVLSVAAQQVAVYLNNGNGTFRRTFSSSVDENTSTFGVGDYDSDGALDLITQSHTPTEGYTAYHGTGNGTFTVQSSSYLNCWGNDIQSADFNEDGLSDFIVAGGGGGKVLLSNGDGSFSVANGGLFGETWHESSVSDLNGDGHMDFVATAIPIIKTFLGRGDGTFSLAESKSIADYARHAFGGDLNGDGALELIALSQNSGIISVFSPHTHRTAAEPVFSLASRSGALEALQTLTNTKDRIALELGAIGSYQSRFSVALSTLAVSRENFLASASRIADADIATEASLLTSHTIVQQAAAAVLSHAKVQPELALQLLAGR